MFILKILGSIDIISAILLLMLIFGMSVFPMLLLFCAILLLLKGLFVLGGDVLSIIDIGAALIVVMAIFFTPFTFILWTVALLLFAKGFVSLL